MDRIGETEKRKWPSVPAYQRTSEGRKIYNSARIPLRQETPRSKAKVCPEYSLSLDVTKS